MSIQEIVATIEPHGCNLVEITGGEPLLQPQIGELSEKLLQRMYKVLLETSGALDIGIVPSEVIKIMDIKCPDSGMTGEMKWDNLEKLTPNDEIKFVINSRGDYDWSVKMLYDHQLYKQNLVLFSPVYKKMQPQQLAEWILQDNLPVRFQIQLHKVLWGETPGR
jgi:7-carboxy-7-deazaguanine synthase